MLSPFTEGSFLKTQRLPRPPLQGLIAPFERCQSYLGASSPSLLPAANISGCYNALSSSCSTITVNPSSQPNSLHPTTGSMSRALVPLLSEGDTVAGFPRPHRELSELPSPAFPLYLVFGSESSAPVPSPQQGKAPFPSENRRWDRNRTCLPLVTWRGWTTTVRLFVKEGSGFWLEEEKELCTLEEKGPRRHRRKAGETLLPGSGLCALLNAALSKSRKGLR